MARLVVIAALVAVAVGVQGHPTMPAGLSSAAADGNWDKVHQLLKQYYEQEFGLKKVSPINFTGEDVRNLKPESGGRVWGEAEYTFHTETKENGNVQERSGGRKIINDNGKVTEFNFTPQIPRHLMH